MSLGSWDAALS